jgi:hypothetical protein
LAIIEISDSVGSLRTVTNVAGRFIFPKIRPGRYKASVVFAELPRRYRVEKDTYEFEVGPGGTTSLEILAVADGGRIKILSVGELSSEAGDDDRDEDPADDSVPVSPEICVPADWAKEEKTHHVTSGESLSLIAQTYLGEAYLWPVIWGRNSDRIANPHRISVGLAVRIPARRFTSERSPGRWTRYTFTVDDSVESVAKRFFGLSDLWPLLVPSSTRQVPDRGVDVGAELTVPGFSVQELSRELCGPKP